MDGTDVAIEIGRWSLPSDRLVVSNEPPGSGAGWNPVMCEAAPCWRRGGGVLLPIAAAGDIQTTIKQPDL